MKEKLSGGKGDNRPDSDFDPKWLAAGIKVESEHTDDPAVAKEIAKDHLTEDPLYYKKLRMIEKSMVDEMLKSDNPKRHLKLARGYRAKKLHHEAQMNEHLSKHDSLMSSSKIHDIEARKTHEAEYNKHEALRSKAEKKEQKHFALHREASNTSGSGNNALVGAHGGQYHISKRGKRVYRKHAQVMQNIKTATKAAMHSMRAGKIGHYEKARQFLSRYDNHSDPQVRRVLSAAHDVLHRSAKAMIGKSKTAKAAHIYTLISKHHNDKANGNLPATMNKAKVDKTDYEPLLKESVGILQRLKSKGAHNPTHPDHAGYKSELRSLKFNMEKHAKQQLHLEKRRNKKGVVVGKWVGAKKTPKKLAKKPAKKPKKSAPKAPKKPKKTAMKKPAAKKVSKKKADYKKSDMYKLQIALDSVMKNPAQNQEKSDKLNWKLIEHALKQGDDKDVSRALKHVQEVMK